MPKTLCRSDGPHFELSRRRPSRAALSVILPILLSVSVLTAAAASAKPLSVPSASVVRAGSIGEVLSAWQPATHLYVLGDVGLGEDTLRELAGWLGDKHWTVLLVADASGQTYRDADGVARQGEDAIEYGTGQGIPRRAGFSSQIHPRTGEADGAILTIVLAQRALFYTGSKAQDSRGLGENQFRGNLDHWAVAAMRSGGDIVSAVKDTVTGIDGQLDATIEGQVQELRRNVDTARLGVQSATTAVASLEEKAARLLARYPALSGPLVRPGVQALRQRIAAAELSLTADPAATVQAVEAVQKEALAQIQAIEEYPAAGEDLEAAGARLATIERRERAAAAREELASAGQALAEARKLYRRGIPGYAEKLASLQGTLSLAEEKVSAADDAAVYRRSGIVTLLCLLGAALLAGVLSLNRRRRGVKREAEQLLAAWREALDRKLEVFVDELERRADRFVGPASGEGKRPFAGETLRLSEQIRSDIGSFYILWTSAGSVLEKAEALIRARGLAAVYNFLFPGRYRQRITLLKDEPVPFDPGDGLPRLFGAERTWRDDLLGDLASYEPFRKSFQEIVGELNVRAARAADALGVVERSLTQGPVDLEEAAARLRRAASRREEIEKAGTADGLFRIPEVFARVLPAAEAVLARARALFATDPVAALRDDGARAGRIAVEAARLTDLVADSRHGVLPAVENGAVALRDASIATLWIEDERRRLSGVADFLAARLAEAEAAPSMGDLGDIGELEVRLADFGARAERAAALAATLVRTARPEIGRVRERVDTARRELGGALALPADGILREAGADPSERLEDAGGQADAAHERLGAGDLDAAGTALAEAARLTAEAEAIVEATRQAFAAQEAAVEERRAETERIERLLPDHERILAGIQGTFAATVLSLRDGDPEHPGGNVTLTDNLEEARVQVGLARENLDRAIAAFRAGSLLAAARLLREVKEHQELAVHRLEEIAEREARLARTVASNRELLAALEDRAREDRVTIAGDPRVMAPTVAAFEEGERRVQRARGLVEAAPGDPLAAEDELLAAQAILGEVHDRRAPSDILRFVEARKSFEAAARQLSAVRELARHAAVDAIPNSPEIDRGLGAVASLSSDHERAREALNTPHGDWNALDVEADRITAEGARWAATLQGEIAAGERATEAFSKAAAVVRRAASWDEAYGVTIPGRPGANSLSAARSLLEQGRYAEAEQESANARTEAVDAIEAAREQVRLLRAEEQRREEARERSRSSFSSSSSSSSGSGGGSSWGGGSSSGSGSSSYGSSGSGSGKSGW